MNTSTLQYGVNIQRIRPATAGALATTVVLWASAFAAIRYALPLRPEVRGFSPGALALLRFAVASGVLGLYGLARGMRLPAWRDWPAIFALGVTGIAIYHVMLNTGEMTVRAGAAGLLINTAPIFTAILARVVLHERLRALGWAGILVSFAGAALIAVGEGSKQAGGVRFNWNALLIVCSAFCTSVYFVAQKPYLKKYSALELTTYAIWAGTAAMMVFLPPLTRDLRTASWQATAAVAYLGIFPAAIAYVTWAYALSHMPAARAASFMYLTPALTFLIAWRWLGEPPEVLSVVGGAVAIGGVILVNTVGRKGAEVSGQKSEVSS